MLREMFRSKPEAKPKGLFQPQELNTYNLISENSTNPVTVIQNTIGTNSKRGLGLETVSNCNQNYNAGSNISNNSKIINNIESESNRFPSSSSLKGKANSTYSANNNAPNNNITGTTNNIGNKTPSNYAQQNKSPSIHQYNQRTETSKEEPQVEYYNTSPTPKEPSKARSSSSNSTNRLQTLESFISQIKYNVYEKSKDHFNQKERMKDYLRTNVDILSSNIRSVHREHKVNGQLNKTILKENDRLISTGERASRDTYFMNKELPMLRVEIEEMKTGISQLNEETKYIRNDSIQIDREIMLLKDDIKKTNGLIAQILKQKEKLTNAIVVVGKHVETTKEKIDKQERASEELMCSVKALVDESSHVYDYMKL